MKVGKRTILGLFFVLLVGQFIMPGQILSIDLGDYTDPSHNSQIDNDQEYRDAYEINEFGVRNDFVLSQDTETGIFDPVVVEQSGYYNTGSISGRTDIASEGFTDIPIDNASNWVASSAEMELWNLNREYVENGTFDEGIGGNTTYPDTLSAYPDGWGIDWDDPSPSSKQTLISYYDNSSDYVTVEIGGVENSPTISYDYYDSTYVLWDQTIQNVPYSDNMTLSFSYNYANGVIDNDPIEIPGYAWVIAWVDTEPYILIDLLTEVDARNTWYDFELTNITGAPSEFVFSLGIWIYYSNTSFNLNPASDYDEDGGPDYDYTRSFKVHFDDVSLVSVDPPTPEEIELSFHAGDYNTTITGSGGNGTASIDYQYWNDSQLAVGVTANVSISFDYEVWVLEHFFSNSSWTTHPTQKGVTYSVDIGKSADLSMYTYIGGDLTETYENFSVFIYVPPDWDNATIYDPFTNDVTGNCAVESGLITIPITLLTRLGWWEIDFQSPNYVKSVQTQIDQGSSTWENSSVFRSGNDTRTIVEIGTQSTSPVLDGLTNVTWMLPNGTIWTEESLTNGTGNIVTSSRWTLGGMNTTAGQWSIDVLWSNGTEIAYDYSVLEMYHSANLIALNTEIETDEGLVVTNFLQYIDIDNNEYLMDASATIVGNWSSTQVTFSPDLLRNRWTADFDTSLVSAGHYAVVVNASLEYFDDVSCQFTINSTYVTNFKLFDIGDTPIEVTWNENYDVACRYELGNGTGITGATIQTSYSGPANGLSFSIDSSENNGNYTVTVTCLKSGTYSLTIKASKNYHYQGTDSFTIIVGEENTNLIRTNGTADYIVLGNDYRLVLQYINSTGYGLIGADLAVVDVSPSTGLSYGSFSDDGNGYYSITLTPSEVETFTIVIRANLTNHVTQITTFTLTVSEIPTELILDTSSTAIAVTGQLIVQANFTDDYSAGLENALLEIIDPPAGLDFTIIEISNGIYNITINPTLTGIYLVTVSATLTNYQTSISSFSVVVLETGTTLTILNGTSDIIIIEEDYKLVVRYTNSTGHGLTGANLTVVDVSPSTGLSYGSFSDDGNGYYSITLTPSEVETFTIVINGNLTNHVTQIITFTLTGSEIPTELTLDTASVTTGLAEQTIVQANFTDNLSTGIEGAQLEIIDPPTGLGFVITEDSNGIYNISISSTLTGIYLITVSATLSNYQTSISSFSVVIEETGTTLTILNGTSDIISIEDVYTLVIQYTNSTGYGLDLADLTVIEISPAGLSNGSFIPLGSGYYSVLLTPTLVDTYTITIKANLTNHVIQIGTFTLTITEISTTLSLNVSIATILVSDVLIVQATLVDEVLDGVVGAALSIANPPAGLDFIIAEVSNGNYTITIDPSLFGSYLITVIATKPNYQSAIASFSIIVEELTTSLTIVNGTSGAIQYGEDYGLVLNYLNGTGFGLANATISIISISPASGLNIISLPELENGSYLVTLDPTLATTFTIVFQSNLTNYNSQFATFTITVSEIPTVLNIDNSGSTVSIDIQHTVQLTLEDDDGNPLENATINVLNSAGGLLFSTVEELLGGVYRITITPTVIGTYQIAFRASLENYHNSTVGFTLIVRYIPTLLYVVEEPTSDTMLFSTEYVISLIYNRTDTEENILSASFNISTSIDGIITWDISNDGAVYTIIFKSIDIGRCRIYITADKSGHIEGFFEIDLDIIPITTSVDEYTLIDDFVYGRPVGLNFNYQMSNDTGIIDADVTPSGSGAQWITIEESGNGLYVITITPMNLGSYDVILTFTKDGFETITSALSFTVVSVQIEIIDIQGLTSIEGTPTTLSLQIVESDTGQPVSGVLVQFQITTETDPGEIRILEETSDGVYSTSFVMPSSETNSSVKIYVSLDNYELDAEFYNVELTAVVSEAVVVLRTVQTVSPFLILLGAVVVGLIARRVYTRRKMEQNIEALLVKRRFEDIRGLLGVIVLHKHSGIPIYSKIIKGGLNEDLISGFISAITQFRSGFEMDQSNWVVVPISDIIRSVATENMLCAFITLATPSKSQELKMIDFAEAVGFVFDKEYTEPPMMTLNEGTLIQFSNLFDDHLDGQFLRKFMIAELSGLPSNPRCVGDKIRTMGKEGSFNLADLASKMTECGIEEARAYKIIWDAIENDAIITVDSEKEEIVITETSDMDSEIESIEDPDDEITVIEASEVTSEADTIDFEPDVEEPTDSEHSDIDSEIESKKEDNGYE